MITIDLLRNAYFGLAARYARGGNMRHVRFGHDGFSFPESVTNNEEAVAFANKYISEHPDLSDEEKANIRAMANSFAGHSVVDTTATGSGVPQRDSIVAGTGVSSADSIATGAGVNPGGTVVGTVGGNAGSAPAGGGGASTNPWDNLPDLGEVEIEDVWPEVPANPILYGDYKTPEELRQAAMSGENLNVNYMHPENKAMLDAAKRVFLLSPEGKAWKAKKAKEAAEAQAYGLDQATRAKYRYGMEQEDKDRAYWEAQRKEAEDWLNSDEGKNAFAIDLDSYIKPVEEEDLGNEGVTDYNDFYNNASRKEIRGVAHGKGWTNANGEELLWTGDNRRENRKYARSVRQGRRQDIRNIRNGQPRSEEYRYAPRFERDGGAMMRTFIGAMRRGGRL